MTTPVVRVQKERRSTDSSGDAVAAGEANPKWLIGHPNTRSRATLVRPIGRLVAPLTRFLTVRAETSPSRPVISSKAAFI
ncbi:hypothetical protein ACFWWA_32890 [Streptomyces goshikiensis]|uniref:hypothetical protein n=1 Tax=Streptomyces goshikiensis TaxID=1942 RepID=UPI003660AB6B